MANQLKPEHLKRVLDAQRSEITEYHIYKKLAKKIRNTENRKVLEKIADDELRHYHQWKKYSGRDVTPNRWLIFKFYWIARLLGLTFGIKLMENGEAAAQKNYDDLASEIPEAKHISKEENDHEAALIGLIEEEHLKYVGSIVLGLNDALVEITGTLAGLTFALQNNNLVAMAGLITGTAGALSMAASEYLSTKTEGRPHEALKSALYTGAAYVLAVLFLIVPYLISSHYLLSLGWAVCNAILIILFFSFYTSVVDDLSFKKRFSEMAILSTTVALISFGLGWLFRMAFGIDL